MKFFPAALASILLAVSPSFAALAQDAQSEEGQSREGQSRDGTAAIEYAVSFAGTLSVYMVNHLRYRLSGDAGRIVEDSEGLIDPILMQATDIEASIAKSLPNSIGRIGCISEDNRSPYIVGFYDPITHIWVVVQVAPWGEILDSRLGRGFPREDGSTNWWPYLVKEEGGNVAAAVQTSSVQQVGSFISIFEGGECPPFEDVARRFLPSEAAAQIRGIEEDWRSFSPENETLAIESLYERMGQDPGTLRPAHMIMVGEGTVLVPFREPDSYEWVFMSRWKIDQDSGIARIAEARTVPFLPQPDGEGTE